MAELQLDFQALQDEKQELTADLTAARNKLDVQLANHRQQLAELQTNYSNARGELLEHRKLVLKFAERLHFFEEHCCCVSTSVQAMVWRNDPLVDRQHLRTHLSPWKNTAFAKPSRFIRMGELMKFLKKSGPHGLRSLHEETPVAKLNFSILLTNLFHIT